MRISDWSSDGCSADLSRWGAVESGTTGTLKARAELTGEGDSVRESLATSDGRIAVIMPAGTFWTRNTELAELDIGTFVQKMFEKKLKDPVQINCGLIAFTVRNGVAEADPILIDTSKNVMLGRGGFSLKNDKLDIAFQADSKKSSLFSVQRSYDSSSGKGWVSTCRSRWWPEL